MSERETCDSQHRIYSLGVCTCSLECGHPGVHEDESVGIWWPRDDQLETW